MKTFRHITALALSTFVVAHTLAADVGTRAKNTKSAVENEACKDEGTFDNLTAKSPMICTEDKWRKVVFKMAADGTTEPLFYAGRCSLRFNEGDDANGKITLRAGEIADVCLPLGWKVSSAAMSDSVSWLLTQPQAVPNLIVLKAAAPGSTSTLWIYPKKPNGEMGDKFTVSLHSQK
jgi:hypothetical protein